MKTRTQSALLIVFFATLYFALHHPYIKQWPLHIHAWTQTDRLALAKGFVDNDLDFFHPQTYLLKEQFPDLAIQERSRITPVDFPLHDYIPAVIMRLTGHENQAIFRLYIFFYGLLGLIFLFKLAYELTHSYFKAWLVVVLASTSPVFVFYHSGFLPTIPSLANACIGLYFYFYSIRRQKRTHYWLAILSLTLAALSRTTFVIPLIAVFGFEFFRLLHRKTRAAQYILPMILSLAVLLFYRWHNANLQEKYGTIFLTQLLPPENFQQAVEFMKTTVQNWGFRYFSWVHYLIGIFIVAGVLWRKSISELKDGAVDAMWGMAGFILLGCTLFFIAMMQQFPAHDYYFLDTFFLPVLLLIILMLRKAPMQIIEKHRWLQVCVILIVIFSTFLIARNVQNERRDYGTWNRSFATYQNFQGSDEFLDSLGIDQEAIMMVVDAYVPNVPMMLMDRMGYALMTTSKDYITRALNLKFDYLVFQKSFFVSDVYTVFPEIINHLHKIGDNEKIMICTWTEKPVVQSLTQFLGLEGKQPLFEDSMSFDNIMPSLWQKTDSVTHSADKAVTVGFLDKNSTYGLTFKTLDYSAAFHLPRLVYVSFDALIQNRADVYIAVSLDSAGENLYFETRNLSKLIKAKDAWKHLDLLFQLPSVDANNVEFGLFFWNTGGAQLLYDNVSFKVY